MKLIQRIGYYLGGFSIGLVLLAFFLSGKKTSCAYGPEARVLKNLNSKTLKYNLVGLESISNKNIDESSIKSLLKNGNVNFSKSNPRQKPCGIYIIEGEIHDEAVELSIENCDSIAKVLAISTRDD